MHGSSVTGTDEPMSQVNTADHIQLVTQVSIRSASGQPPLTGLVSICMSEYWVSHKKYWCKFCEIFIADDAPSRAQHENGLRHQGNKERFVRNLYKTGQKRKQDQDEEEREVARIEQAPRAAFAGDVAAGYAKGDKSSSTNAPPPVKSTAPCAGNVLANYTTAKDLGITEEDEAAALALKQSEGRVGQWEVVTPAPTISGAEASSSVSSTRKRPRNATPEADEEDPRTFKMRQKKLSHGLGEVYDPGAITIKPKEAKALQVVEDEQPVLAPLVWKPTEWSVGPVREDGSTEKATELKPDPDRGDVKPVVETPHTEKDDGPEEKAAVEVRKGGGMFKKRKVPKAGTTERGNRRV